MSRLAAALAPAFDVVLLDGGPPEPQIRLPGGVRSVPLAPLVRSDDGVVRPWHDGIGLQAALADRRRAAVETIRTLRPAVVILEFYPFSRRLLHGEIEAMIDAARSSRDGVLTVSSVRDVLETGFDGPAAGGRDASVSLASELRNLDGVLIHADREAALWDEPTRTLVESLVPVVHTGVIGPQLGETALDAGRAGTVLSVGGGFDAGPLVEAALEAWRRLESAGLPARLRPLHVFLGPYLARPAARDLADRCRSLGIACSAFADDFPARLARAALSISRGGYNTCADILASGVPAVVSPTRINDQLRRAERLAALGRIALAGDDADSIVTAIDVALRLRAGHSPLRLDGAERSAEWIARAVARRASRGVAV